MTAPDPRLDEIQARLDAAESYSAPTITFPTTDLAYLLAELRKAHEALARVEGLADKYKRYGFPYKAEEIRAAVAAANGDGL